MHTIKRLKFYSEVKEACSFLTPLDYSVITGGFAQNSEKLSDVDIITVIPHITASSEENAMIFIKKHVEFQVKNGFAPDYLFPSDVLSRQQIIDAVNGRALHVENGELKLKGYSNEEMENNPEADYRVWLYEMITHNFDIISGSFDLLCDDTLSALRTVWLYTSTLYGYEDTISFEQVRRDLFCSAGLPYCLNEKQCCYFLIMLRKYEMGTINNDGILLLNVNKINRQLEILKETTLRGFYAKHFLEWNALREKFH